MQLPSGPFDLNSVTDNAAFAQKSFTKNAKTYTKIVSQMQEVLTDYTNYEKIIKRLQEKLHFCIIDYRDCNCEST